MMSHKLNKLVEDGKPDPIRVTFAMMKDITGIDFDQIWDRAYRDANPTAVAVTITWYPDHLSHKDTSVAYRAVAYPFIHPTTAPIDAQESVADAIALSFSPVEVPLPGVIVEAPTLKTTNGGGATILCLADELQKYIELLLAKLRESISSSTASPEKHASAD